MVLHRWYLLFIGIHYNAPYGEPLNVKYYSWEKKALSKKGKVYVVCLRDIQMLNVCIYGSIDSLYLLFLYIFPLRWPQFYLTFAELQPW